MARYEARRTRGIRSGRVGTWVFRAGVVAILYTAASAVICWHFVAGYRGGLRFDPAARGVPYEEVHWKNDRGQTIRGCWARTDGRPAILLAHGHRANRGQLSPLFADLYLHCRFGVLAFDFRGSGDSDGRLSTAGATEAADLEAAVDFLKRQGIDERRLAVVAYDMGGIAALGAVRRMNRLGALVVIAAAESPRGFLEREIRSLGLPVHPTATLAFAAAKLLTGARFDRPDPGAAWRRLTDVPTLLVAGEQDLLCPVARMRDALARIPAETKELAVFARDHRGLVSPEASAVIGRIRRFLLACFADE